MALSDDLISQFVKTTQDKEETKKETSVYGTIVKQGDTEYVQLDGSELLTPISATTVVKDGDRVIVTIKNHTAIVTGDLTTPSANIVDVQEIGNKISEFEIIIADKVSVEQLEAEIAKIDTIIAGDIDAINGRFETIEGKVAEIDTIKADVVEIDSKLTAHEGEFTTIRGEIADFENVTAESIEAIDGDFRTLESDFADFKSTTTNTLTAYQADIEELDTKKLDAESAKVLYANIDFSNIGEAAIEKLFGESGIIKDLIMQDGKVTGELVGVTIKGDLIEGNTVKADKLVILGEDGIYYKLNVDALGETTASSDEKYQNGLDGSVIIAKSITADRIAVTDLVAFGATIGGFHIDTNSLYSGTKASVDNTTEGIFLGDDGQFAVGDGNNFLKYFKDENGNYKLEIGISGSSVIDAMNDVNIKMDETMANLNDLIKSSEVEYYLSSSYSSLKDGEWSTSIPEFVDGKYVWTRTKNILNDDSTVYIPSENGTCMSATKEPIKEFNGENVYLFDSGNYNIIDLTIDGKAIQEGVPYPDTPFEISVIEDDFYIQTTNCDVDNIEEDYIKVYLCQNYIASLPNGVKDQIVIDEDENVKLIKNINKIILNGDEEWSDVIQVNDVYRYNFTQITDIAYGYKKAICSHFKQVDNEVFGEINEICFTTHPEQPMLSFFTNFETLDEFKTWLTENPITVYYQLSEPYETKLYTLNSDNEDGINYVTDNDKTYTMVTPDSGYNQYPFEINHPMAGVPNSTGALYDLSFKFIPEQEGYLPATSIVVGGKLSGDRWDIRLTPNSECLVEQTDDYYIYKEKFYIPGDDDCYLSTSSEGIRFILESESVGGTVSDVWLEEYHDKLPTTYEPNSNIFSSHDIQSNLSGHYYTIAYNDSKERIDQIETDMRAKINIEANRVSTEVYDSATGAILTLLNNNYLSADQVNTLIEGNESEIATIKNQLLTTVTSTEMQIAINTAISGGVSYLKNTLFTINETGMWIATSADAFNAQYNNKGMYLYSYDDEIAKFDVNGATVTKKLKVEGELETNHLRMIDVTVSGVPRTHIHFIG